MLCCLTIVLLLLWRECVLEVGHWWRVAGRCVLVGCFGERLCYVCCRFICSCGCVIVCCLCLLVVVCWVAIGVDVAVLLLQVAFGSCWMIVGIAVILLLLRSLVTAVAAAAIFTPRSNSVPPYFTSSLALSGSICIPFKLTSLLFLFSAMVWYLVGK